MIDLLLQIQALLPGWFLTLPADTFFPACWGLLLCGLGAGLLTGGPREV